MYKGSGKYDSDGDMIPKHLPYDEKNHTIISDREQWEQRFNFLNVDKSNYEPAHKVISSERAKQYEKGYTPQYAFENPEYYDQGQLIEAAMMLTWDDASNTGDFRRAAPSIVPLNWDPEKWLKLLQKSYYERLIIAGSFIAAQVDYVAYCKSKKAEEDAKQQ